METLWGDENLAPAIQPKPAAKKQKPATYAKQDCVYYGHTWKVIGMLGEKQCIVCGQKTYCLRCTKHPLKNAEPAYCSRHGPNDQEK